MCLPVGLNDFAFYGNCEGLELWVCRGRAKADTTRLLRVATAYVIRDGERVTLAVTPVTG